MKLQKIMKYYIMIYAFFWVIVSSIYTPSPVGEWDDYSLMTISLIQEGNFTISQSDLAKAKEFFPEWSTGIDHYALSGYVAKNGEELAWYFFTYSLACVPITVLLHMMGLSSIYAFSLTNCFSIIALLYLIYRNPRIKTIKKLLLIVLLSINPIIFYFTWASAEVFIYALLGISMMHWTKEEYKRAAFCISLAGTLNPTIMVLGIAMIIEYVVKLIGKEHDFTGKGIVTSLVRNWKKLVQYAACFWIALIPFFYNYYQTGHINLTASYSGFINGKETPFQRFLAYFFDLNFGFLPYYGILLMIAVLFFIVALYKKIWKYLLIIVSFCATVFAYSFMVHINCGMSGIARYNAWSAVVLIYAAVSYYDSILGKKINQYLYTGLLGLMVCINCFILYRYGAIRSYKSDYIHMTPIARFVLNYFPSYYNPLYSTFYSRVNHIDGGYDYKTPVIFFDETGSARKILASSSDKELLADTMSGASERDEEWFRQKLEKLGNADTYLSIPIQYHILQCPKYTLGDRILFFTEQRNADLYVKTGLSHREENFAWTNGPNLKFVFRLEEPHFKNIHAFFEIDRVFCSQQSICVLVNDKVVLDKVVYSGENLEFDFELAEETIVTIELLFPDAVSPLSLGESQDNRQLAFALKSVVFTGWNDE